MKIKDIKVGEEYEIGADWYGRVLEVGLETTTWRGKSRKNGVLVRVTSKHRRGEELVFTSRDLSGTRAEGEAKAKQRELDAKRRDTLRNERDGLIKDYTQRLKQMELGPESLSYWRWMNDDRMFQPDFTVTIQIQSSKLERILELLETEQDKVATGQSNTAEAQQSGSALEQILKG